MARVGLFDDYRPLDHLVCPWRGGALLQWQGRDGPCWLLPWVQGFRHSVVPVGAGYELPEDEATAVLPERFVIYTTRESGHRVVAEGRCVDDVWRETRLLDESEYR